MILTVPHLIRALRWIPPGVTILGTSCTFLNFWAAIRALTLPLPGWVYSRLEEMLYSNYQAMVGFWYETWSGVEVHNLMHKPAWVLAYKFVEVIIEEFLSWFTYIVRVYHTCIDLKYHTVLFLWWSYSQWARECYLHLQSPVLRWAT